ncbi:hypothetical protein DEO72_LG11g2626 [Vigna unguiculata]|uniref:TF-B3 domain-containing protein n=1 Tax=Vigna unguiculata TaxID=3917 RepID=A0A4D6NSG1_VIGUN|nr:hypothetical protein DEO72_LG11g2626 [Vigna unguiculata]
MQSTISLDPYFHLFWEKKTVFDQEMEFVDPNSKTFKFKFHVTPNATTIFRGPIRKMFKYYNLKDEVYLHMSYVSLNVFLIKLFSVEGIEIAYTENAASCSGTAENLEDVPEDDSDNCLIKCLTAYDVVALSLYLNASFVANAFSTSKKECLLSNGNGMYWQCSIRWAQRARTECYLGCGWRRFVTENKLCAGDRIKLEVRKNEDNLIVVQKI